MKQTFLAVIVVLTLALVLIGASASTDPAEAARLNNLGVAYMNQQLFEKALKAFEEAAAKDPSLKVATLNRGVALLNLQKLEEAKALLEKAAKEDPGDAHAGLISASTSRIRRVPSARWRRFGGLPRLIPTMPTPGIFWAQPMRN